MRVPTTIGFVSLECLALTLGLPHAWLRDQADAGAIPFLRVGRRRLFNVAAVSEALTEHAAVSTAEGGV